MKPIKIFLSLIVFAVCAAFSFPAYASTPKPVLIPLKAEKITPAPTRKAVTVNFVRTDALVMYETAMLHSDSVSTRRPFASFNENFVVARAGISKFFRFKPEFKRRVEIIYV